MADEQITKWNDDEIIELLTPDMEKARTIQDTLSIQRQDYYKRYRCEPYGNERAGWSQSVAPVIHNNHKWTMANLMDIFNEDFFLLKGEDEERSAKFQKLIYYQMFRKQDGFKKFYDFLWTADLYHYAVFKVYYKEEFDLVNEKYEQVSEDQFMAMLEDTNITVTKFDEDTLEDGSRTYSNVKVVKKDITFAGPCITIPPLWEIFYSADCKLTDWGEIEGRLVYHQTKKTLNDVRKKEKAGIYRKGTFDKLKDKWVKDSDTSQDKTEFLFNVDEVYQVESQVEGDDKETLLGKEIEIKECYYKLDIDGDGLLEDVIVDICDDVVCRVIENPYKRPPFRFGSIAPEPHKITGQAMPSLLDNDQKIQTNLLRLIQDSGAMDCYKNPVTNDHQMFTMLQERKPFAVIKGDPAKLGEVKTSAPSQFVLKAYEMMKQENEEKTGMTRYNQGMDASSLNKTATGIDAIMAASNKPLRLIARLLGNGPIMGVIRDFIFINQLYPPEKEIRILGTDIAVNSEDMTGAYTIEIDIGVSSAERQAMANQCDLLIQFGTQAGLQLGLMERIHIARAQRKKFRYLGFKIDDLMKSDQTLMQEDQEKSKEPPKQQDWKEFVQIDKIFSLLTPAEQFQILTQLGIKPDPRRFELPPQALSGEPPPQPEVPKGSANLPSPPRMPARIPAATATPMDTSMQTNRPYPMNRGGSNGSNGRIAG